MQTTKPSAAPFKRASQTIEAQRDDLARAIVARQYDLEPETWQPYGDVGWEKSLRDTRWHLSYLAEALAASDASLFVDYVAWVKVLFANLNFPNQALVGTLQCTHQVIDDVLPPELAALAGEYIQSGLARLPQTPSRLPSFLEPEAPLAGLARRYLDALLRSDRQAASQLILGAVAEGTSVRDVYLYVFQPTQYEIGRLWQENQISVAQEHYSTAVTQLVMSQLYPHIFSTEKIGRRLVATCVGGELHEIGMRMVADFFEMAGWDTYYIGANAPAASVVEALEERQAHVLGVSATMTFHVNQVADLIARVRASQAGKETKILVGGYPFNVSPELWRGMGADGYAGNAQEAIALANRLTTQA